MAVTWEEIERSKQFLISQGATRIILFGSAQHDPANARDLDLACEGIPPEKFFAVAARLDHLVNVEVDLIELSDKNRFTRYVERKGKEIFGAK